MNRKEYLKSRIEEERRILDRMLETGTMQDALTQSRKLDGLMEEYLDSDD